MKPNQDIQKDTMTELAWKELIQAIKPRDISVSVSQGNVTLSGTVDNYSKKLIAERIVSGVSGVTTIINNIVVKISTNLRKKDEELTDSILNAFIKEFNEPEETFAMKIENDWLTIVGEVENTKGQKISVQGKVCRLEEIAEKNKKAHHPSIITNQELAYWEIFG